MQVVKWDRSDKERTKLNSQDRNRLRRSRRVAVIRKKVAMLSPVRWSVVKIVKKKTPRMGEVRTLSIRQLPDKARRWTASKSSQKQQNTYPVE